ncbi:LacI family transcriptional regulator [Nonlabens sp. YIK11]|uniref:LacI family DNA-binding transcriptional regulator n=1 Tax=Nonlabens sp. YIK11 TaxID=1453349 RepID=UPI0006DD119F|nr:LacI family DNA-binding transcriptional regulator [Nonlabens sp. YIK11]KQC32682.1 LacI family transcriptional regulator [Nonlabens sp. YIK11]
MKKKTTIYDIAAKLNLTAATVSRALNDNKKISENTRKLVKQTALEMNYEQNTLARALKSGKSFNVGVIVPRMDSNFFASVIRGIEEELYPQGYHVIICQTHDQESLETGNINSLLNAQVDGVLMSISNSKANGKVFDSLFQKQVPLIFFDRKRDMEGISSVTIDDFDGAYTATKHLIDQGCKRIVHLSNNRSLEIFRDRYAGYKQALLDHGLEFDENLVIESASKIDEGRRITKEFLEMEHRPDGIFSSSDFTALGAIQEIKAHGLKIPQDICVVGFSNEPFTRFMDLSISSVDQSPIEMGRLTAQVFLEEVNNKKKLKTQKKIVLKPELVIRKSSQR